MGKDFLKKNIFFKGHFTRFFSLKNDLSALINYRLTDTLTTII